MENKQTAVEWYDAQLKEIDFKLQSGLINFEQCKVLMSEAFDKAKEMEKEQIKDAWLNSLTKGAYNSAEEYYNETFNGNSYEFKG